MSKLFDAKGQELKDTCVFLTFPSGINQKTGEVILAKLECIRDGCKFYEPVAGKCKFELACDKILSGGENG